MMNLTIVHATLDIARWQHERLPDQEFRAHSIYLGMIQSCQSDHTTLPLQHRLLNRDEPAPE